MKGAQISNSQTTQKDIVQVPEVLDNPTHKHQKSLQQALRFQPQNTTHVVVTDAAEPG